MVETKVQSSSAPSANRAGRKDSRFEYALRGSSAASIAAANVSRPTPTGRLSLEEPALLTAWAVTEEHRRQRARKTLTRSLRLHGEAASIAYLIASFVVVCALGALFVSLFAGVAAQGRQVYSLTASVAAAQARHDLLVQQYTRLSSPGTIQARAGQLGMVRNGPSVYVTLTPNGSGARSVEQLAMAPH